MKRKQAYATEREKMYADTLAIVKAGKCPICGSPLRENLSIIGWWQCDQLGAVGFRVDPSQPSCYWQGFTQ